MKDERLKELELDNVGKQILTFIPNNLGINLSEVEDVEILKRTNGELVNINIKFVSHSVDYGNAVIA